MQRISTPSRVVDLFGPGKDGFAGGGPPMATELEPAWFNNAQEEIANVIEGQGIVLDGLQFDQLKTALDVYKFLSPTINGTLTIASGGTLSLVSGSTLTIAAGATATINTLLTCTGDVVLGNADTDSLIVAATTTHNGPAFFSNSVELNGTVLINGATSVTDAVSVLGASGGSLSSDPSALLQWNGQLQMVGQTRVLSGTSALEGDISKDGSGNLQYRDATATRKVHASTPGWVYGHGQTTLIAVTALAQLDTSAAVAPKVSADLDVAAEFWVQRGAIGDIIVSLIEVGGLGQISTNQTVQCTATSGTTWERYTFSRTRVAADTTPRVYRLEISAAGNLIVVRNARITVSATS